MKPQNHKKKISAGVYILLQQLLCIIAKAQIGKEKIELMLQKQTNVLNSFCTLKIHSKQK